MSVHFQPDGYHTITPYLFANEAEQLIQFLKAAFSATTIESITGPDGRISHAEVKIGDSIVMLGAKQDATPMHAMLYIYVEDTDACYQQALSAGATSISEPADQFYGDRNAGVEDPFGNKWWIATRVEILSKEEVTQRAAKFYKNQPS